MKHLLNVRRSFNQYRHRLFPVLKWLLCYEVLQSSSSNYTTNVHKVIFLLVLYLLQFLNPYKIYFHRRTIFKSKNVGNSNARIWEKISYKYNSFSLLFICVIDNIYYTVNISRKASHKVRLLPNADMKYYAANVSKEKEHNQLISICD